VVSIRAVCCGNTTIDFRHNTVNIDVPQLTQKPTTIIVNLNLIQDHLYRYNRFLETDFELFEHQLITMTSGQNYEPNRNHKFFGCIDESCISLLRFSVTNQILRLLPSTTSEKRFILANEPVIVEFQTEIFVVSADYARLRCELLTNFMLGGMSFTRSGGSLIFRNVHASDVAAFVANRFTL